MIYLGFGSSHNESIPISVSSYSDGTVRSLCSDKYYTVSTNCYLHDVGILSHSHTRDEESLWASMAKLKIIRANYSIRF